MASLSSSLPEMTAKTQRTLPLLVSLKPSPLVPLPSMTPSLRSPILGPLSISSALARTFSLPALRLMTPLPSFQVLAWPRESRLAWVSLRAWAMLTVLHCQSSHLWPCTLPHGQGGEALPPGPLRSPQNPRRLQRYSGRPRRYYGRLCIQRRSRSIVQSSTQCTTIVLGHSLSLSLPRVSLCSCAISHSRPSRTAPLFIFYVASPLRITVSTLDVWV